MNIEKMIRLKEWFDNGAPHFLFDMDVPYATGENPEELAEAMMNQTDEYYDDKEIPQTCGSAGCIAGAAVHLFGSMEQKSDISWPNIRDSAADHLDLPCGDEFYHHDLFNPYITPSGVTAKMASEAIQRVIDGKEAWS